MKNRIYNSKGDKKASAQYALYNSLLAILKMMAPICPFITEEIYQQYFKKNEKDKSIHISSWPEASKIKGNEKVWNKFVEILGKVRQSKSDAKKSMKAEINLTIEKKDQDLLKNSIEDLQAVTGSKEIKQGNFKVDFLD